MSEQVLLVFYDNWCPLCTRAKRIIEKADRRKALRFMPLRDEQLRALYRLDENGAERRLYSLDAATGEAFSGIGSIVEIARRVPVLRPLYPLLYLVQKLKVGDKIYDWLAHRRRIIPVGQCEGDACRVRRV